MKPKNKVRLIKPKKKKKLVVFFSKKGGFKLGKELTNLKTPKKKVSKKITLVECSNCKNNLYFKFDICPYCNKKTKYREVIKPTKKEQQALNKLASGNHDKFLKPYMKKQILKREYQEAKSEADRLYRMWDKAYEKMLKAGNRMEKAEQKYKESQK